MNEMITSPIQIGVNLHNDNIQKNAARTLEESRICDAIQSVFPSARHDKEFYAALEKKFLELRKEVQRDEQIATADVNKEAAQRLYAATESDYDLYKFLPAYEAMLKLIAHYDLIARYNLRLPRIFTGIDPDCWKKNPDCWSEYVAQRRANTRQKIADYEHTHRVI